MMFKYVTTVVLLAVAVFTRAIEESQIGKFTNIY